MTTITQVQLVAPQQLGNADATFYTAPAQTTAKIGRAVFTNTSASAVTITAGITPGGALGPSTTMISARTLAPGESYVSPELAGAVLPSGSALRAYSSAATSVTFTASGLIVQ
ncbi:MAG: hypothetical protein M0Z99_01850 [Betaproteobacteria bacterium]|nr:hypothetical protein [Betaproteobacteria bacterium]